MYIPEFWAGVAVTLFVEFVIVTVLVIVSTHDGGNDE